MADREELLAWGRGKSADREELLRLASRFKPGANVVHTTRGWRGVVTGEPSDSGKVWCRFEEVGQYGADPRLLAKQDHRP